MSRAPWLLALVLFVLLLPTADFALALGSREPRIRVSVVPSSPHALEPARIELHTSAVLPASQLRVRAQPPKGAAKLVRTALVGAHTRRGTFTFLSSGTWNLLITDPAGRPAARAAARRVRVLNPVPTPSPEGFAALGEPGCEPPSPTDSSQLGLRDVFGTAYGHEELWALPFLPEGAWAARDSATIDGAVGKGMKIVFGMTSFHAPFVAEGPDGTVLRPASGLGFHLSSNWIRQPGVEWGSVFVFPAPGCWRVRVGAYGSVWLLIRS